MSGVESFLRDLTWKCIRFINLFATLVVTSREAWFTFTRISCGFDNFIVRNLIASYQISQVFTSAIRQNRSFAEFFLVISGFNWGICQCLLITGPRRGSLLLYVTTRGILLDVFFVLFRVDRSMTKGRT